LAGDGSAGHGRGHVQVALQASGRLLDAQELDRVVWLLGIPIVLIDHVDARSRQDGEGRRGVAEHNHGCPS
jgi:hypothetical protein